MLLKRTGIPYSRKKENLFMYVMKGIAHRGCIKGFVYRFMYVRVREKMAGKVTRHPDSVFDGFSNMNFIIDFKARLEEKKRGEVENTQEAANEEQHCFSPKDLLQKIFSLRHVEIYVRRQQQQRALFFMTIQVHTVFQKPF